LYEFEWHSAKAAINLRKHNVDFKVATSVFFDPLHISKLDEKSSEYEERWLTIGTTEASQLLVVHHTFYEDDNNNILVRIISARKATRKERQQYKLGE